MKKNLLFAIICVLGLFGSLNAQKTITLGEGETTYSSDLPYNNSWCYSTSQQLYRSDELNIEDVAKIESIAFKSASENLNESYIQVYMKNTSKSSYIEATEWVPVTENDKVFEGYINTTGLDEWSTIELTTPFIYTGSHVLVCVNICFEYYWSSLEQDLFYTYSPSATSAYSCTLRSDERIDVTNVTAEMLETASLGAEKNQIQFVYSQKKEKINVNFESIDMGEIVLGEYWSEKEDASVIVSAASYYTSFENVTCSDPFFVLSEIDYNVTPLQFTVTCDKEGVTAGEKSAEITITDSDNATVVIPITAKVYEPVTPDVFELAKEVTFTDGVYTDEPDFATLRDDYLLPNEKLDSNAPDAVYSVTVEDPTMLLVDVDGPNAKIALYAEDFGGKEGPMADNVYTGEEKILSTTFAYDFSDGNLDNFTIVDNDEYKDYTWFVEDGGLVSFSFYSWWDENNEYHYINKADERLITKETYTITPNSVFELDICFMDGHGGGSWDNLIVELTKDEVTFTQIELLENFLDPTTIQASAEWQNKRIDLGAKFTELGLEYGDYKVSLYHKNDGSGLVAVDNFTLTERDKVFVPGNYYVVVAADDAFEVTISLGEIPEEEKPGAPTNLVATPLSDSTVKLTWDPVEGALGYGVLVYGEPLALTLETTIVITDMTPLTEYCFTVVSVIKVDANNYPEEISEPSEVACVYTLGVEELETSFNIYPNPVENELFIETEMNVEEIAIYDVYGRQTMVYGLQSTDVVNSINVAELNSGVYFVKIVTNDGEIVKRFVKK